MSTLSVMQPYLFPYPPYFSLLTAADRFVVYDDVQFIRRGYIHRNQLAGFGFSVPVIKAPQETAIREIRIAGDHYGKFRRKLLASFEQRYRREAHYAAARHILETVITETPPEHVAELAIRGIETLARVLDLSATIVRAGDLDYDRGGRGQDRILALADALNATRYVNPAGGADLYDEATFRAAGRELLLLRPRPSQHSDFQQFSILHGLAVYGGDYCREQMYHGYELLKKSDFHAPT